jgi:hypothetical protein
VKEFAGFVSKVNLDGRAGCAEVDVRCLVPVDVARRLSALMVVEGSPVRVAFPEGLIDSCTCPGRRLYADGPAGLRRVAGTSGPSSHHDDEEGCVRKSNAKCRRCGSKLAWMTKGPESRAPWLCVYEQQCKRRQRERLSLSNSYATKGDAK